MRSRALLLALACAGASALGSGAALAQREPTCAEVIAQDPDFRAFHTAMERVGMQAQLSAAGPITVFALMNNSAAQTPGAVRALFAIQNVTGSTDTAAAVAIADHFIVEGRHTAAELRPGTELYTIADAAIPVIAGPAVRINGYTMRIVKRDQPCRNGVVHGVEYAARAR